MTHFRKNSRGTLINSTGVVAKTIDPYSVALEPIEHVISKSTAQRVKNNAPAYLLRSKSYLTKIGKEYYNEFAKSGKVGISGHNGLIIVEKRKYTYVIAPMVLLGTD